MNSEIQPQREVSQQRSKIQYLDPTQEQLEESSFNRDIIRQRVGQLSQQYIQQSQSQASSGQYDLLMANLVIPSSEQMLIERQRRNQPSDSYDFHSSEQANSVVKHGYAGTTPGWHPQSSSGVNSVVYHNTITPGWQNASLNNGEETNQQSINRIGNSIDQAPQAFPMTREERIVTLQEHVKNKSSVQSNFNSTAQTAKTLEASIKNIQNFPTSLEGTPSVKISLNSALQKHQIQRMIPESGQQYAQQRMMGYEELKEPHGHYEMNIQNQDSNQSYKASQDLQVMFKADGPDEHGTRMRQPLNHYIYQQPYFPQSMAEHSVILPIQNPTDNSLLNSEYLHHGENATNTNQSLLYSSQSNRNHALTDYHENQRNMTEVEKKMDEIKRSSLTHRLQLNVPQDNQEVNHYHSKYYEKQKQMAESKAQWDMRSDQQSNSARPGTTRRYSAQDHEDIGLGNPQNLAAFDLPLSSNQISLPPQKRGKPQPRQSAQKSHGCVTDRSMKRDDMSMGQSTARQGNRYTHMTPRDSGLKGGGLDRATGINNYLIQSGLKTQRQAPRNDEYNMLPPQQPLKSERGRAQPNMSRKNSCLSRKSSARPSHRELSPPSQYSVMNQESTLNFNAIEKKFSLAESQMSGQRLHGNARIYEAKKITMRNQQSHQIETEMKEKPSINSNTTKILGLKLKIKTAHRPSHAHHDGCYFNIKKQEEDEACTHQPVICPNTERILENKHSRVQRDRSPSQPIINLQTRSGSLGPQRNILNNENLYMQQLQQMNDAKKIEMTASKHFQGASIGQTSKSSTIMFQASGLQQSGVISSEGMNGELAHFPKRQVQTASMTPFERKRENTPIQPYVPQSQAPVNHFRPKKSPEYQNIRSKMRIEERMDNGIQKLSQINTQIENIETRIKSTKSQKAQTHRELDSRNKEEQLYQQQRGESIQLDENTEASQIDSGSRQTHKSIKERIEERIKKERKDELSKNKKEHYQSIRSHSRDSKRSGRSNRPRSRTGSTSAKRGRQTPMSKKASLVVSKSAVNIVKLKPEQMKELKSAIINNKPTLGFNIFKSKKLKIKKTISRDQENFYDKNIKWLEHKQKLVEKEQEKIKDRELDECFFQPNIYKYIEGSRTFDYTQPQLQPELLKKKETTTYNQINERRLQSRQNGPSPVILRTQLREGERMKTVTDLGTLEDQTSSIVSKTARATRSLTSRQYDQPPQNSDRINTTERLKVLEGIHNDIQNLPTDTLSNPCLIQGSTTKIHGSTNMFDPRYNQEQSISTSLQQQSLQYHRDSSKFISSQETSFDQMHLQQQNPNVGQSLQYNNFQMPFQSYDHVRQSQKLIPKYRQDFHYQQSLDLAESNQDQEDQMAFQPAIMNSDLLSQRNAMSEKSERVQNSSSTLKKVGSQYMSSNFGGSIDRDASKDDSYRYMVPQQTQLNTQMNSQVQHTHAASYASNNPILRDMPLQINLQQPQVCTQQDMQDLNNSRLVMQYPLGSNCSNFNSVQPADLKPDEFTLNQPFRKNVNNYDYAQQQCQYPRLTIVGSQNARAHTIDDRGIPSPSSQTAISQSLLVGGFNSASGYDMKFPTQEDYNSASQNAPRLRIEPRSKPELTSQHIQDYTVQSQYGHYQNQ